MIREHFQMLQGLVDRGIASQVEIHYNTNGTQWPENAEEIWRHFRTVEIAFSIDDIEQRFEYQRTNAVWAEVEQNIQRFRELRSRHSNIQLQACCTVNIFNVLYLDHVADWIMRQNFNFVYWNVMHDAWYFSVSSLPDSAKATITQHLESSIMRIPSSYRTEFQKIIEFMNRGASTDGFMTRMKINDLDRKRNQSLRNFEPELADLLGL